MKCWLYQMSNERGWITVKRYRKEMFEGDKLNWDTGRITSLNKLKPGKGDLIILFFAERNNKDPGLYGDCQVFS